MPDKILVVEDDPTLLQSIVQLLALDGYDITTAVDGEEGIKEFKKGNFDVVVTDVKMPKINGIEMMKALKAFDSSAEIIVITGFGTMSMTIEVMRLGAYDFLKKPEDLPHRLRHTVEHALEKRALSLKNQELLEVLEDQIMDKTQEANWLATQHAITNILAESTGLEQAVPKILSQVLERLEWDMGIMWQLNRNRDALQCIDICNSQQIEGFASKHKERTFSMGEGLPGAVWEQKRYVIPDEGTLEKGVGAVNPPPEYLSIGFPVMRSDRVFGVMEFFHDKEHDADSNIVRMLVAIANQLGMFIEREQFEHQFLQSQKMEAIGRLAGGIAHDFNNILTSMIGQAHLIEKKLDPEGDLKGRTQQIQKTGHRAAALIQQLMTFSRSQILRPELHDINQVIESMEPMLRRLLTENIDFKINLDRFIDPVIVDQAKLEQVILNLVVNARDAMPDGGRINLSTIKVKLDAYQARLDGLAAGKYICLDIRDTGQGMNDSVKEHIFEPFFTTKDEGKGTGLGLATVYGIVTQSKGGIKVASEPGMGTTFSIYLPTASTDASEDSVETKKKDEPQADSVEVSETLLIVEDEEDVRDMTRQILEQAGYKVLEAANGSLALDVLRDYPDKIDLVMTDLIMPTMNGAEFVRLLRESHPDMNVVFISGYSDEILPDGTNSGGDIPLLTKPFDPEELLSKIREIVA